MLSCTIAFQVVLVNQIIVDWKTYKRAKSKASDTADQYRGDWVVKAMFFFIVAAGLIVLDYFVIMNLVTSAKS